MGAPLKLTSVSQTVIQVTDPTEGSQHPTLSFKTNRDSDWDILAVGQQISLNVGDYVEIRAHGRNDFFSHRIQIGNSQFTGNVVVEGDITTLLDPNGDVMDLSEYEFSGTGMFEYLFADFNSTGSVANADGLILPSTVLRSACYKGMFAGNSALTSAKFTLPAEEVYSEQMVYAEMFDSCNQLQYGPDIMLKNWDPYDYGTHFSYMFNDCIRLQSFRVNFDADTFIASVQEMADTQNWMLHVGALGVFYATDPQFEAKLTAAGLTRDENSVPESWQISTWSPAPSMDVWINTEKVQELWIGTEKIKELWINTEKVFG